MSKSFTEVKKKKPTQKNPTEIIRQFWLKREEEISQWQVRDFLSWVSTGLPWTKGNESECSTSSAPNTFRDKLQKAVELFSCFMSSPLSWTQEEKKANIKLKGIWLISDENEANKWICQEGDKYWTQIFTEYPYVILQHFHPFIVTLTLHKHSWLQSRPVVPKVFL